MIGSVLTLLIFGAFLFAWQLFKIDLLYRTSPVLGDELVITLGPLVDPEWVRDVFALSPTIDGELVWLEELREFRFLPNEPLAPEVTYRAYVGTRSRIRAGVLPTNVVFAFTTGRGESEPILVPDAPHERYIDVNLATSQITLVDGGRPIAVYPLAAQGSPWTSPTRQGTFSVLSKEPNHLSNIYYVYMPLAIRYSGPYFIHAWPYWPSGAPIISSYSGGCIRMLDHDMQEIYDWARVGDTFVVHETPGKIPIFSADTIGNGDLVRVEGEADVYVLKEQDGERYKRHVFSEQFGDWYPHLERFWPRIKTLLHAEILKPYFTSRWVLTEDIQENGHRYIYEIREPGVRHLMYCGDGPGDTKAPAAWKCEGSWEAYGWPKGELYSVSDGELAAYAVGDTIDLPVAPWAGQ